MKHIAAPIRPCKRPHPLRRALIRCARCLLRLVVYSFTCQPARVFTLRSIAVRSPFSRPFIRAQLPKLRTVAEGAVCMLWLLFLIFGLNFFAALV